MMSETHTPGPWTPGKETTDRRPVWSTPETDKPPSRTLQEPMIVVKAGDLAVCYCWSWRGGKKAMKANAQLIAAAPDLLAACKDALQWLLAGQPGTAKNILANMEAAIAKAKGD